MIDLDLLFDLTVQIFAIIPGKYNLCLMSRNNVAFVGSAVKSIQDIGFYYLQIEIDVSSEGLSSGSYGILFQHRFRSERTYILAYINFMFNNFSRYDL